MGQRLRRVSHRDVKHWRWVDIKERKMDAWIGCSRQSELSAKKRTGDCYNSTIIILYHMRLSHCDNPWVQYDQDNLKHW